MLAAASLELGFFSGLLDKDPGFLSEIRREELRKWWLALPGRATTPTWDILSTCTIAGECGLLLVEAKAHHRELSDAAKRGGSPENRSSIARALRGTSDALSSIKPGWNLGIDSHYQLANRFAWAWKVASLGVPVVLLYLGFLNAWEMEDRSPLFAGHEDWEDVVRGHAAQTVPEAVWDSRLNVPVPATGIEPTRTVPKWALIRSLELRWVPGEG